MSAFGFAILAAVVLSITAIGGVVYVLKKREQYTREKFAFTALAAFTAFAGTIATSIAGHESPWTTITNLVRAIRGLPKEQVEPRLTDHMLLVLILVIVAVFTYRIFMDWKGAISIDEHGRGLFQSKPDLVRDGLDEGKRIVQRKPRQVYGNSEPTPMFSPLDIPSDSLEWHLQAIDLITLKNPSYRFDLDHDYHPEARCWIGEFAQTNQTVAVPSTE
jgi:hypothetical protein